MVVVPLMTARVTYPIDFRYTTGMFNTVLYGTSTILVKGRSDSERKKATPYMSPAMFSYTFKENWSRDIESSVDSIPELSRHAVGRYRSGRPISAPGLLCNFHKDQYKIKKRKRQKSNTDVLMVTFRVDK